MYCNILWGVCKLDGGLFKNFHNIGYIFVSYTIFSNFSDQNNVKIDNMEKMKSNTF